MEESQNLTKGKQTNTKNNSTIGSILFLLFLIVCIVLILHSWAEMMGFGSNKRARETAELAVQNKLVNEYCPVKSKVVYKKSNSKIVAVKYWPTGNKKDFSEIAFVHCSKYGDSYSSIVTISGIDYDHIPKNTINQLKLKWEIK